jgi:hypothetical protein
MTRLYRLLRDHAAEVEADLQRYYRVDLRDLWRGGLTMRRLRALIDGLPGDAMLWTAVRRRPDTVPAPANTDALRWGTDQELAAAMIDAIREVTWAVMQANARGAVKRPKPFPRPRVGAAAQQRTGGMSAQARARIDSWVKSSGLRRAGTRPPTTEGAPHGRN